MKKTIIFILSTLILCSCTVSKHWSEKKRAQFAETCAATDTLSGAIFYFKGYMPDEVAQVQVARLHGGAAVDSFHITPRYFSGDMYEARIEKTFYLRDTYRFIASRDTFFLSDMGMKAMENFGAKKETWYCDFCRYSINGKITELGNAPQFVKKGYDESALLHDMYNAVREYELSNPDGETADWAKESKGYTYEGDDSITRSRIDPSLPGYNDIVRANLAIGEEKYPLTDTLTGYFADEYGDLGTEWSLEFVEMFFVDMYGNRIEGFLPGEPVKCCVEARRVPGLMPGHDGKNRSRLVTVTIAAGEGQKFKGGKDTLEFDLMVGDDLKGCTIVTVEYEPDDEE